MWNIIDIPEAILFILFSICLKCVCVFVGIVYSFAMLNQQTENKENALL